MVVGWLVHEVRGVGTIVRCEKDAGGEVGQMEEEQDVGGAGEVPREGELWEINDQDEATDETEDARDGPNRNVDGGEGGCGRGRGRGRGSGRGGGGGGGDRVSIYITQGDERGGRIPSFTSK